MVVTVLYRRIRWITESSTPKRFRFEAGQEIRALFFLEHTIEDGRIDKAGNHRVVSRQLQFIEIDSAGATKHAGYAIPGRTQSLFRVC